MSLPLLADISHDQDVLLDRRLVYETLIANHIPVPNHIIVNRDGLKPGRWPGGAAGTVAAGTIAAGTVAAGTSVINNNMNRHRT